MKPGTGRRIATQGNRFTCVLVIAAAGFCLGRAGWAVEMRPSPAQVVAAIKETARQSVSSRSPVVIAPELTIDRPGRTVYYNLGKFRGELSGLGPDDPYRQAYALQTRIEALRSCFARAQLGTAFGAEPLRQAEGRVAAMVAAIEAAHPNIPEARLQELYEAGEDDLNTLVLSIRSFAQRKGYAAKRAPDRTPASDGYAVQIQIQPPTGRVRVVTMLQQRQYLLLQKEKSEWRWRSLVGNPERLIGTYYYLAEWPGGKQGTGTFTIRGPSTQTFKPDPN